MGEHEPYAEQGYAGDQPRISPCDKEQRVGQGCR